jgi:hypothetical protein
MFNRIDIEAAAKAVGTLMIKMRDFADIGYSRNFRQIFNGVKRCCAGQAVARFSLRRSGFLQCLDDNG